MASRENQSTIDKANELLSKAKSRSKNISNQVQNDIISKELVWIVTK